MANALNINFRLTNLKCNEASNPVPTIVPLCSMSSENSSQKKIIEVAPGLFLGDYSSACNERLLRENHITVVINLTGTLRNKHPEYFHYENFSVQDDPSTSLNEDIGSIISKIHCHIRTGKRILVHCRKAISRGPSIAMGYLIRFLGYSFDEAFQSIQAKKADVDPNLGFVVQLQSFK